jgi:hypothetical protein
MAWGLGFMCDGVWCGWDSIHVPPRPPLTQATRCTTLRYQVATLATIWGEILDVWLVLGLQGIIFFSLKPKLKTLMANL